MIINNLEGSTVIRFLDRVVTITDKGLFSGSYSTNNPSLYKDYLEDIALDAILHNEISADEAIKLINEIKNYLENA